MQVSNPEGRAFYEAEAARSGWSYRQLDRQIDSMFYERTALSKNKSKMLKKGSMMIRGDRSTPEEEIKDPYVLEFLGLKDEYSESQMEEALILRLEQFLLELGGDFAFIGRQKRLRVGDAWYRVDLLLFHRRLRCLVIVDLKVGQFTHASVNAPVDGEVSALAANQLVTLQVGKHTDDQLATRKNDEQTHRQLVTLRDAERRAVPREPISAAILHQVNLRDGRQCAHIRLGTACDEATGLVGELTHEPTRMRSAVWRAAFSGLVIRSHSW